MNCDADQLIASYTQDVRFKNGMLQTSVVIFFLKINRLTSSRNDTVEENHFYIHF
jgi:hypothetical protein